MYGSCNVPSGDGHRPGGTEATNLLRVFGRRRGVLQHLKRTPSTIYDDAGGYQNAVLSLKAGQCRFAYLELKFHGHVVSGAAVCPDTEETSAVGNLLTATNKKDVRSFLGLYFCLLFSKDRRSIESAHEGRLNLHIRRGPATRI